MLGRVFSLAFWAVSNTYETSVEFPEAQSEHCALLFPLILSPYFTMFTDADIPENILHRGRVFARGGLLLFARGKAKEARVVRGRR